MQPRSRCCENWRKRAYSKVDVLGAWYKFVNFRVGQSPGSPNWWAQIDCYSPLTLTQATVTPTYPPHILLRPAPATEPLLRELAEACLACVAQVALRLQVRVREGEATQHKQCIRFGAGKSTRPWHSTPPHEGGGCVPGASRSPPSGIREIERERLQVRTRSATHSTP